MRGPILDVLAVFALSAALLGSSCNRPYNLTISTIDEIGPQSQAVIQISDAQVYARETLVNDRRTEIDYLTKLLSESATQQFHPQLRRDIRSVTSIAGQLSVAFDPAKGVTFDRAKQLGDIQQEINRTKLLAELEKERANLAALQQHGKTDSSRADRERPARRRRRDAARHSSLWSA